MNLTPYKLKSSGLNIFLILPLVSYNKCGYSIVGDSVCEAKGWQEIPLSSRQHIDMQFCIFYEFRSMCL